MGEEPLDWDAVWRDYKKGISPEDIAKKHRCSVSKVRTIVNLKEWAYAGGAAEARHRYPTEKTYRERVLEYEAKGLTTSDAQAAIEAEIRKQAEEEPPETREAFAYSFASKSRAIEFCRRAKQEIKNADRFELMHSNVEVVVFPWHCVMEGPLVQGKETTKLDEELVEWHKAGVPRPDEICVRDVEVLKGEGNFLIAREVWDP